MRRDGIVLFMQEEVFDAELLPGGGNYGLNLTLAGSFSIAVVFLFLAMGFGEVLSDSKDKSQSYEWWETPLQERHKMDLNLTQDRSVLPQNGS